MADYMLKFKFGQNLYVVITCLQVPICSGLIMGDRSIVKIYGGHQIWLPQNG